MLSIDFCVLLANCSRAILHAIEMTLQCTLPARYRPYLAKSFVQLYVHASSNGLNDDFMDNSNTIMVTLSTEPRKRIITLQPQQQLILSHLLFNQLQILLDARNAATASKPNVARVTIILK